MKTLFCLLSTFGIGIAAFGMAKENSSVRCQQMFQGFPSGWGIAPALAEKLYHTSPDGRLDITVGLGMIDLIEQMPNVYFDSLGFYLAMEPHLDFSSSPRSLWNS